MGFVVVLMDDIVVGLVLGIVVVHLGIVAVGVGIVVVVVGIVVGSMILERMRWVVQLGCRIVEGVVVLVEDIGLMVVDLVLVKSLNHPRWRHYLVVECMSWEVWQLLQAPIRKVQRTVELKIEKLLKRTINIFGFLNLELNMLDGNVT